MNGKIIPYFKYPTTTVVVDDKKEFLDSLTLTLDIDRKKLLKTFTDPKEAISYLLTQTYIYTNYQKYLEDLNTADFDGDDNDKISRIKFSNIHKLIYDKKRFSEISVIVIDYVMPEMDGIECFKQLKNIPSKKILLTGNEDYQLAVEAFNQGLIDKFVVKKPGIEKQLFETIHELSDKYFQGFSSVLLQTFDIGIKKATEYTGIFSKWCSENKISEYYQCDGSGSYLGFDKCGNVHWFLISSLDELNNYLNIAKVFKENSTIIINLLESKKELLFFLTEEDKHTAPSEWKKYMFPIWGNFTTNNKKYFYSFASGKTMGITPNKIASFKHGIV